MVWTFESCRCGEGRIANANHELISAHSLQTPNEHEKVVELALASKYLDAIFALDGPGSSWVPSRIDRFGLRGLHLQRRHTQTVPVAEEQDPLALALRAFRRLDPVAHPGALPQALQESHRSTFHVRAVVFAHDGLDGLGGLVGAVEGNGRDKVVEDVGFDDPVEQVAADEAEFPVDRRGRATSKSPCA